MTDTVKTGKIALMTATGQHNLGDELILVQEIRILQSEFPSVTICVFTHDVRSTRAFLEALEIDMSDIVFRTYFPNHIRRRPLRNLVHLIANIITIAGSKVLIIG